MKKESNYDVEKILITVISKTMYQGLWLNNKSTMRKKKETFNGRVNSKQRNKTKGTQKNIDFM